VAVGVDFGAVVKVHNGAFVHADEVRRVEAGIEIAEGGVPEKTAVAGGGKDEFVFGQDGGGLPEAEATHGTSEGFGLDGL